MSIRPLLIQISIALICFSPLQAQSLPSGDAVRDLMLRNWLLIEDYEVDIKLDVNIPGFRMPARKIHYLFKAPDKSKVEVKGFAIVPKRGIQPFITFLEDSLDFQVVGESKFEGHETYEVTVTDTFMNQAGEIRMWIDQNLGNVYRVTVSTEERTFFDMHSSYTQVKNIFLPESSRIKMLFHPNIQNLRRLGKKPTEMREFEANMTDEWVEGTIEILFDDYEVNQGLPDHLFEDNEEDLIQD